MYLLEPFGIHAYVEVYSRLRVEGEWRTNLSTPDRDSNLDLLIIGGLFYYESSALDHVATEFHSKSAVFHSKSAVFHSNSAVFQVVGKKFVSMLSAHYRVDSHPFINSLHEVLTGQHNMYLVFPRSHGDLHSHVRLRKRLREPEAKRLFRQIAEAVRTCHEQGIVLRDLKLRKFVFSDTHRTQLKLETLEDAVVLEDSDDDVLRDKRGCPAYVCPEILRSHAHYSGRAADMWSLGVLLYTMLVGRYPFNDTEHASLFAKISRGNFIIPDCLSSRAKCLIRSLLQRDPSKRVSAEEVILHPWLTREDSSLETSTSARYDQLVPIFPTCGGTKVMVRCVQQCLQSGNPHAWSMSLLFVNNVNNHHQEKHLHFLAQTSKKKEKKEKTKKFGVLGEHSRLKIMLSLKKLVTTTIDLDMNKRWKVTPSIIVKQFVFYISN
uniref:Protein kinase domain-containing protein n=1 Tax=Timema cristinae TaxID=61476 RepID=A0A7R9C9H2_TIMCR|nr:unnamed protein product [Timema cristinae]